MADEKIKKLKVKQSTGIYGDYIPLGADAKNVDLTNGQTVEENINYINTELLVAKDVIDEVTASSFTLPIASNLVLGGIKIGDGLSIDENGVVTAEGVTDYNDLINTPELAQVAISGSYNDLTDTPIIPAQYVLPIATAADLGGIRIGTGLNIDATGVVSVDVGVTDYNDLENLPDLTVYAQTKDLSAIATSGDYNDLNNTPSLAAVATSGSYNDLSNKPTIPSAYTLPTASSSVLGGVKVGSGLSINSSGVLSATSTSYTLPTASTSTKGGITVDGTLLAMNGTTLTAPGYLPLTGGTMTGALHLVSESETNYGGIINFGDIRSSTGRGYVYIGETSEDDLVLYAFDTMTFETSSGSITVDDLLNMSSPHVTGSYTGDGNSYQEIDIGFEPTYVIIFSGEAEPDGNEDGTLCMLSKEGYINHYYWTDDLTFDYNTGTSVYLYDYGFDARSTLNTNWDGATYSYIAFQ